MTIRDFENDPVEDSRYAHLQNGLEALFGHDLSVARQELEWVEQNLDADPDMPQVAHYLRVIVERLSQP